MRDSAATENGMTAAKRPIGYIGLGMMGGGMASHLVKAGYPVTVYDPREEAPPGADVVEMEAAVLCRIAALRGARAACVLAVSDVIGGGRERLDVEGMTEAGLRLGRVAVEALTA